jgi:DNA-binding transcriptional ArsR family regulator
MHLVPAERRQHRMIEAERVCDAIGSLPPPDETERWAERFTMLGDRHRLALLICIAEGGPISVTDLAAATGMEDARVSQILRLLRGAGLVAPERQGRVVRYALADDELRAVLPRGPARRGHRHPARSP